MSARRRSGWHWLIGLVFLGSCLAAGPARAACELRVGWDEWPPYFTYKQGQFQGLEHTILKSIADSAGCKLEWWQVPWARALSMLAAGELDLLYGAGYSTERAGFAKFSISYRQEQFVLMTRPSGEGEPRSISLNDWIESNRKGDHPPAIGVFRGNVYGEQIERILRGSHQIVTLVELSENHQMVGMLQAGRLDGYIVEDGVAQLQLQESGSSLNRYIIEEQTADPLHYMFSLRVADEVVQRFNSAIQERGQALVQ